MRRTGFRRYLVPIGLAVGLTLILTSCFGDEEGENTTTTTRASGPTTSVAPPPPPTSTPADTEPPPTSETVIVEPPPPPPEPPPEPPPPPPEPPRDPGAPLIYTVQQGDTLFSIATQFGVTVDQLIELNNIANPDVIFVDDQLTIPPPG